MSGGEYHYFLFHEPSIDSGKPRGSELNDAHLLHSTHGHEK